MTHNATLGDRIKAARTLQRQSRAQLAAALEMSKETVGRYERDEWKPKLPVLLAIAKATNVPEWFITEGFDPATPRVTDWFPGPGGGLGRLGEDAPPSPRYRPEDETEEAPDSQTGTDG